MKKLIYIGLLCLTYLATFAQEAEQIDLGPYGTYWFKNEKSLEYFETQINIWEKKVLQNKKDANAWLNLFCATKRAWKINIQQKQNNTTNKNLKKFDYKKIADEAYAIMPNSFEANFMIHFKESTYIKINYDYLLKAHELKPFDKSILCELLLYYELIQDTENARKVAIKISETNILSNLEYINAYNILIELSQNAILITEDQEEFTACLVLQKTKNIKPNILVSTHFILNPAYSFSYEYTDKTFARLGLKCVRYSEDLKDETKKINNYRVNIDGDELGRKNYELLFNSTYPVYVSNSSIMSFMKDFSDKLYLHGLTYRYNKTPTNYIYDIKENYEKNYSLDLLKHDYLPIQEYKFNQSLYYMYYPSALRLYQFYQEKGMYLQQQEMKKFIQQLAEKSGKDFIKNSDILDKKIEYPFIAENIDFEKLDKSFQMYHANSTGFVNGPDYIRMGKFEVTNGEFNLFLNNLKKTKNYELYYKYYPDTTLWNKNFAMAFHDPMTNLYNCHPAYSNYPIVNITYEAAVAYCEWLTEQENKQHDKLNQENPHINYFHVRYRLPTEQEWRYAAGSKNEKAITPFPNDQILTNDPKSLGIKTKASSCYLGNIKFESKKIEKLVNIQNKDTTQFQNKKDVVDGVFISGQGKYSYQDDGNFHTTRVTSYPPNSLGIYNTFGNVAEMTSTKGVIKGGSWDDVFEDCTFDKNSKLSAPDSRVGFRMVMEIMEDINDMSTIKIESNLGVDKSEITHFNWEEFLNYQKEYYGANSREYRDNLPDSTLVKKGECEHYNSESYKHPAYRNMPMIGITQQQAQNYTTWRTNRIFERYLESNKYITRIENAPKSDFTVEKYYLKGLTDYTINTVEKYPYVPVFSLPSSEDYQHIKQLANTNNKLNTKSKSIKMTFEIDSIALCNLNEINTFIDPKLKNIVYYLESGIAEWTSDSNKVINGSVEQNEQHRKGAVTDASQLKYIGFRNKVEWKRWEGTQVPGPENIPEIKHNSVVKIEKNVYCRKYEERILDYERYLINIIQLYGINSIEYKNAFPDSTLWKSENMEALKNKLNLYKLKDSIYVLYVKDTSMLTRTFEKTFVILDTLTKPQLDNYLKYKSDEEFKAYLIENEYIKNLNMLINPPIFTKEAYYTGKLDSICLKEKFMYYPVVSVPTEQQKQLANIYTQKQLEKGEYAPTNPNSIYSSFVNKTYYDLVKYKTKSFPNFYTIYELKKGVKLSDIKPFDLWENYRFVLTWKPWNPTKTN